MVRNRFIPMAAILAIILTLPVQTSAQQGEWNAQAVSKAIEKAKAYLWSQWSNGHWPERYKPNEPNYGGVTALCTYALLAAGESHQSPRMKKTLKWLAELNPLGTYTRSLRANVWAMLGRSSPYRRKLAEDVEWLIRSIGKHGGYNYTPYRKVLRPIRNISELPSGRYDNSNSQLAVLGVWAGARNGVEVPSWYWKLVEKHWIEDQHPDGGWSYKKSGSSYGSMSAAGLATMFICFDAIYYRQFVGCKAKTDYPPIVRGLQWMDKNFDPASNPGKGNSWYYYYLYGVERVGLASGYKYFGKKDWYKLGATNLLQKQGAGGGWGSVIDTSFALLFLARGQHPVLFNKLQYPGTWNCRPRDLANLTRWITQRFEKPVNWQIIHMGVPVSEWHDAPILYISGATKPKFTDEDIENLRQFVLQGGVIFSESACSRVSFNMAMQRVYAKMFPRYELKRLSRDHPIYTIHFKVRRRGLMGISNGIRLLAIHSPMDLSRAWQLNRYATQADVFHLAANVYFFVTDKGSLRKRGVSLWPVARSFTPVETVKVARVKYSGNYDPEPLAWKRFSILMGNRYRVKVEVSSPMELKDLKASDWPIAAMTGTSSFTFTEDERQALRKYLTDGGLLLIDAAGGSKSFTKSAEEEIGKLFSSDVRYRLIPIDHKIYDNSSFGIDKPAGKKPLPWVSYRRATRVLASHRPRLKGLWYKGRLVVIFSRDDLTAGLLGYPCWGLSGYSPNSAFALVRNIVLYASGKKLN